LIPGTVDGAHRTRMRDASTRKKGYREKVLLRRADGIGLDGEKMNIGRGKESRVIERVD